MSRWAFMSGDSIVALLDGEPDDWPDLRDADALRPCEGDVQQDWIWDGTAFVPPKPPVGPRVISPLSFRRRFTPAERAAITLAASRALGAGDATLQVWLDDLNSATEVDIDLPEVAAALALLVAAKLVTTARVTVLLG